MRWKVALLLAGLLTPAMSRADVKTHGLCSEGMVLQQKSKVNIWGTADKGEKVTVKFRGQEASAEADQNGNWIVAIPSGEAGGPLEMTIAGKNTINYKDVLVGEVWVCSGQSNMEWSVGACDVGDKESAKSAPANPKLRMFSVQKNPQAKPIADTKGSWVQAKPETVNGFSAVGYFFGRDLNNSLKIPVGLIHTSWGGTRAEAWTSPSTLAADPIYKGEVENFNKAIAAAGNDPKAKSPLGPNSPSSLYNGMIHPILNYNIAGAIWYQGESNAGKAYHYRSLFPTMIKNWRADFKQGDFPFYFVQLAPYNPVQKDPVESTWAELREAQNMTLSLPRTGVAVITDFGSEYDIHPTPKQPVGERLALIARANVYGEKIEYSGPMFKELKVDGNKAVLSFTHTGTGLVAKELVPTLERKNPKTGASQGFAWRVKSGSTNAQLTGFTVAGEDKKFHNAKAEIVGDTVVVSAEGVMRPVAVRYGWQNHPVINLFNREGLPASPFRTDTFPGITQPKQ